MYESKEKNDKNNIRKNNDDVIVSTKQMMMKKMKKSNECFEKRMIRQNYIKTMHKSRKTKWYNRCFKESKRCKDIDDTNESEKNRKKKWNWRKWKKSNRCFDIFLEMNCKKNEINSNVVNDREKSVRCIEMKNHLFRRYRKHDRTITIERMWNLRRDKNSKTRWIVSKIRFWSSEFRITAYRHDVKKCTIVQCDE